MAQLSLDKPIWGIESIKALHQGHPVFLIVGYDDSHLVVKKETTFDKDNLRRNQLSMQIASPQSRSVILTNDEVWALKSAVSLIKSYAIIFRTPVPADVTFLEQLLGSGGTWFKMKEAKGIINLEGAVKQLQQGNKTGVRALSKALNGSGGLEALGKIVGADMFNNNTDRFNWKGGGPVVIGSETVQMRSLINAGNVMAAMSGGSLTMIGLDSWDPWGADEGDMNANVSHNNWLGTILAPSKGGPRLEFARLIVDDLNELLGPRKRRFDFLQKTRLNPDAPQRIVKGMESITKKLVAKLEASQKRPGAPAGIASRLSVLRDG